jgi:hypothetical protein
MSVTERENEASASSTTDPNNPSTNPVIRAFDQINRVANVVYWAVCAVLVGVVGAQTVASLLFNASLRYDEINVSLSITERPYSTLHPPLDYLQSAPVGWLWMEKALTDIFGPYEIVLRAPSLVATIGTLVLMAILARRTLPPIGALLAMVVVATNHYFSFYAYNAKPYALDMTCALALVLAAMAARRSIQRPPVETAGLTTVQVLWANARRSSGTIAFWAIATVTSFISFPALFCTAAIAVVLGIERLIRGWQSGGWRGALRAGLIFTAAGMPWFAMVGFDYVFSLAATAQNQFLFDYFKGIFPKPGIKGHAFWAVIALGIYSRSPLCPADWGLGYIIPVGAAVLIWRRKWDTLLIVAPLAIGFTLAFLGIYPMADRMAIYSLPLAVILILGTTALPRSVFLRLIPGGTPKAPWDGKRVRAVLVSAVAVVLMLALVRPIGLILFVTPVVKGGTIGQVGGYYKDQNAMRTWTQSREILTFVKQHWKPGDVIIANPTDEPAFRFYGKQLDLPLPHYILIRPVGAACTANAARPLFNAKRVWLVSAFGISKKDQPIVHALFGTLGPKTDTFVVQFGEATAYQVTNPLGPNSADPALVQATGGQNCMTPVKAPFTFPPPTLTLNR